MPGLTITHMDHCSVIITDVAKSRAFYADLIGLREIAAPNTFDLEWPPRSGRIQQFPEIDRAEFFPVEEAKRKINEAQIAFLDRLAAAVELRSK